MHTESALTLAAEVRTGLTAKGQKRLPTRALYDDVGSALFEAITALPEYGLTRAEKRLLLAHAEEIAEVSRAMYVLELGSGSGAKTRTLLSPFGPDVVYRPIDVSRSALDRCQTELAPLMVEPVEAEFLPGLRLASAHREKGRVLVAFLGSNIGNFDRSTIVPFFQEVRSCLQPGDTFLLGADLIKPESVLTEAYDDGPGVTAAFNRNLLARVNREFHADFDLRCFVHEARWNPRERRIEMHLRATVEQVIQLKLLDLEIRMRAGETLWTESSHKFDTSELLTMGSSAGFQAVGQWTDREWPFTEILFEVLPD